LGLPLPVTNLYINYGARCPFGSTGGVASRHAFPYSLAPGNPGNDVCTFPILRNEKTGPGMHSLGGGAVSPVGVVPTRTVSASASIIFPCSIKIQRQEVGKPSLNAAQLYAKAECFFWYWPTRVVPEQRPLNGCCCCCCLVHRMLS